MLLGTLCAGVKVPHGAVIEAASSLNFVFGVYQLCLELLWKFWLAFKVWVAFCDGKEVLRVPSKAFSALAVASTP